MACYKYYRYCFHCIYSVNDDRTNAVQPVKILWAHLPRHVYMECNHHLVDMELHHDWRLAGNSGKQFAHVYSMDGIQVYEQTV